MRPLSDIIQGVKVLRRSGPPDPLIRSLCFDSRRAEKGSAFFAIPGTVTDGHKYIETARRAGALAVICQQMPGNPDPETSYVQVEDSALALGQAAANFFSRPSESLKLIGITGTNGKTTIATLLHRLFTGTGHPSGLISTVTNIAGSRESPPTHTTPDPLQINRLLLEMLDAGCEYCFMEVSSHAIHQKRVGGLTFSGGIFTNISHEHLDYHKTFGDYIQAKKAFFDALPAESFALVNRDDRNATVMVQNCRARVGTYGLLGPADVKGKVLESHLDGMLMQIGGREIWTRLAGEFNARNVLAVYACALECGLEPETALTILSRQTPVTGRFETLQSGRGITAVVDYAHTPDALKNVLEAILKVRNGKARLITVVGAGGNRDATKRPLMGQVAAQFSQKLILTSDNPRYEKPEEIIHQMLAGIPEEKRNKVLSVPDRREAIKTAVMLASSGDIILVAGKGHENYQEIEGKRYPFNDLEILRDLLQTNE